MLKKSLSALVFCLFLGYAASAQTATNVECNKYSDASLGFSLCMPTGWTVEKDEDGRDEILGKNSNGMTPNINFESVVFRGSVSATVDEGVAAVLKNKPAALSELALDRRSAFTAGKAQGVKVVFKVVYQGVQLKSIQYFFGGRGDVKILITATMPWSDSEELESLIDDSMRTFALSK